MDNPIITHLNWRYEAFLKCWEAENFDFKAYYNSIYEYMDVIEKRSELRKIIEADMRAVQNQIEKIDSDIIEIMYQAAKERITQKSNYTDSILASLQSRLESCKTKESRLLDTFLAEQISKDIYDVKILEIHNERVSLNHQIKEAQTNGTGAIALEPIKNVFLEASRATDDFLIGNDGQKRKVIEKLLWNLSITNRTVANHSFKSPYEVLARSPKTGDILTLCAGEDSNLHSLMGATTSR